MASDERFPTTATTLVEALMRGAEGDAGVAAELLARAYWKPIYKYVRLRWGRPQEEAEDLTQGFFVDVVGRGRLAGFTPARARLRTFIRRCLDNYVIDDERRRVANKRGGGARPVAFDHAQAERELALASTAGDDPETLFHREWVRRVVELAREELTAELSRKRKTEHLAVFDALVDEEPPPTHAQVAERFGISVIDVQNRLAYARRAFRRLVVQLVTRLSANEEERRLELQALAGSVADCEPSTV